MKKTRFRPSELVTLTAVTGLLALLGAAMFEKHQRKARTAEAVLMIDKMWEGAHSCFDQSGSIRGVIRFNPYYDALPFIETRRDPLRNLSPKFFGEGALYG